MPVQEYLMGMLAPLVTKSEAVKITQSTDDMGVLLTVVCAPEDMGSIIGKSGETAKALRHLVRVAGVKHGQRVSVKINEPDGTPYKGRESSPLSVTI